MSNSKIKLAIVGVGKIVNDQHLPAIANVGQYELIATASRNGAVKGVTSYTDIESMLQAEPAIEAVALCMPPQFRYSAARCALSRGVDVLLEKPPGATVCEVEQLLDLAKQNDRRIYATWHSRYAPAVEQTKAFLEQPEVTIESVQIHWKEDVKKWHPGQEWIWQAGGMGVFDPGINGLSILTYILPKPFYVQSAELLFPSNRSAPIAANVDYKTADGITVKGEFDWRIIGDEKWNIDIKTNSGLLSLRNGGAQLQFDGEVLSEPEHSAYSEYEAIYQNFANIIRTKVSDVDLLPLKLVADAFLLGDREQVDAFNY